MLYYDYLDKQFEGSIVLTPNIFGSIQSMINIPRSHILGSELLFTWVPVGGIVVRAGATYIASRIDGNFSGYAAVSSSPSSFNGQPFPFTPKWSGVGDVEYRWSLADSLEPFIGASIQAQSHTKFSFGSNPALGADDPNRLFGFQGYSLLDLRAGIQETMVVGGSWCGATM